MDASVLDSIVQMGPSFSSFVNESVQDSSVPSIVRLRPSVHFSSVGAGAMCATPDFPDRLHYGEYVQTRGVRTGVKPSVEGRIVQRRNGGTNAPNHGRAEIIMYNHGRFELALGVIGE